MGDQSHVQPLSLEVRLPCLHIESPLLSDDSWVQEKSTIVVGARIFLVVGDVDRKALLLRVA